MEKKSKLGKKVADRKYTMTSYDGILPKIFEKGFDKSSCM